MEVICDKKIFATAISNVIRASSNKTTLPVLEGILLKAKDSLLELCCYDLKIAIKRNISANVLEEGEIVLSAATLNSIAAKLKSETITIKTDENLITNIKGGRSRFKLVGMAASDFPLIPDVESAKTVTVNGSEFKNNLKQSLFAVSPNATNPVFSGIALDFKDGSLVFRATDSYKFIKRTMSASGEPFSCLIPAKEFNDVLRLISDNANNIKISIGDHHALFSVGDYIVILRLISGNFPDFGSIEKRNCTTSIKLNRNDFLDTVRCVSLVNIERLPKPILCSVSEEGIKCSTSSYLGNSEDSCDLIGFSGEKIDIGLHPKHLESILSNIEDSEIKIEFSGERGPIFIKPIEGNKFFAFMAPMVLSST